MRRLCDNENCSNEVKGQGKVTVYIRGNLAKLLGIESYDSLEFCSISCALAKLKKFQEIIDEEVTK